MADPIGLRSTTVSPTPDKFAGRSRVFRGFAIAPSHGRVYSRVLNPHRDIRVRVKLIPARRPVYFLHLVGSAIHSYLLLATG